MVEGMAAAAAKVIDATNSSAVVDGGAAQVEPDRTRIDAFIAQLAGALNASSAAEMRAALMGVDTAADNAVSQLAAVLSGMSDNKQVAEQLIQLDAQKKLTPEELALARDAIVAQVDLAASMPPAAVEPAAGSGVIANGDTVIAGAFGPGGTSAEAMAIKTQDVSAIKTQDPSDIKTQDPSAIKTQDLSAIKTETVSMTAGAASTDAGNLPSGGAENPMTVINNSVINTNDVSANAEATNTNVRIGPKTSDKAAELLAKMLPGTDTVAQDAALGNINIVPSTVPAMVKG